MKQSKGWIRLNLPILITTYQRLWFCIIVKIHNSIPKVMVLHMKIQIVSIHNMKNKYDI